jgi:hypothetical protein
MNNFSILKGFNSTAINSGRSAKKSTNKTFLINKIKDLNSNDYHDSKKNLNKLRSKSKASQCINTNRYFLE